MDERKVSKAGMLLVTSRCPRIRAPSSNTPRGKMALALCRRLHARTLARSDPARSTAPERKIHGGMLHLAFHKVQHTSPGLACSPDKAKSRCLGSGRRIDKRVEDLLMKVDRPLDVHAASSRFSCLLHEADRRQTQPSPTQQITTPTSRFSVAFPAFFSARSSRKTDTAVPCTADRHHHSAQFHHSFFFVCSFNTRARLSQRSRQTPPPCCSSFTLHSRMGS